MKDSISVGSIATASRLGAYSLSPGRLVSGRVEGRSAGRIGAGSSRSMPTSLCGIAFRSPGRATVLDCPGLRRALGVEAARGQLAAPGGWMLGVRSACRLVLRACPNSQELAAHMGRPGCRWATGCSVRPCRTGLKPGPRSLRSPRRPMQYERCVVLSYGNTLAFTAALSISLAELVRTQSANRPVRRIRAWLGQSDQCCLVKAVWSKQLAARCVRGIVVCQSVPGGRPKAATDAWTIV